MLIHLEKLGKSFGEKIVLHDVTASVEREDRIGIVGQNGAGKTTAIRIILGMLSRNSGEVLWNGKALSPVTEKVGYLAEERGLYPKYKISEQLTYFAKLRGMRSADIEKSLAYWFKRLELSGYEDKRAEQLSKGNQQKVQLASTLACEPEIVILDEPFSGLDPVNSKILQEVVTEVINEGRIVIFSSHQMSYVEEFCRDIAIIDKGNIALSGNLKDIKKKYGENQLVISDVNKDLDTLSDIVKEKLSDIIAETGRTREDIIIKNISAASRADILKRIVDCGIDVEHFETYKPSLNDIFVSLVGDEADNDNKKNNIEGGAH